MSTRKNQKKDMARFLFLLAVIMLSPFLHEAFGWFVSLAIVFLLYFILMSLITFLNQETNDH
ncbi:hypothetical protein GLW00_00815 [Halobacillus litoralis]|uniref:Uncharacterized protein n=1 Tax=Halobacillus litoralis TaxID=45668 RepID=A0A845F6P9_9BACI|nr:MULTISPECIES: hypothetical protein [Halobacillus]MEC3884230.1 hypothetical protein [Halobacillus sp. HZG1]MYL69367.1 hypothetical protein [Halobacillus litoralis]